MPREWTRPLVDGPPGPCGCGCALTPETTLGFAFESFCSDIVHKPVDPWQRWVSIHGMELLPDGRPRFRQLLVLVARQNGKTELLVLLTLFWMYILGVGMVLGTSTKLDYARESWLKVVRLARAVPDLRAEIESVRNTNGEQEIALAPAPGESEGPRYKIAAANEEGGRSLTVHRLVEDELRQHRDWSAHEAAENTMNAVADAQAWAISNEGDERAVVLTALKAQALAFIETGEGDYRLGYFGYTAAPGCEVTDLDALAQANPNLGRRVDLEALYGKAIRAQKAGGEQEIKFRTEVLCQRVTDLEPPPIPAAAWDACADPASLIVSLKSWAIDVTPTGSRAAIAVAGLTADGQVHGELVDSRPGTTWVVPEILRLVAEHRTARIKVGDKRRKAVLIDPIGPAADLVPVLTAAGLTPVLTTARDVGQACSGLQRGVREGGFVHIDQQQVRAALVGAARRDMGDGLWAFARRTSDVDISPIVALTLAVHGHRKAQAARRSPQVAKG